jgi:hypothetical protein
VFAQDEGGNGLVGYADVQVNLKDINDNAPLFPQGDYGINLTIMKSLVSMSVTHFTRSFLVTIFTPFRF